MLKPYIKKAVERQNLTLQEAQESMQIIMQGKASDAQIAGFITAMRMKGETIAEITGLAKVMRENAIKVNAPSGVPMVDTCGTGGDKSGTFNISTASALVVSGAGVVVAKHGNRSVSSSCGSADILKALGVNIDVSIEVLEKCLKEIGISFLFAPKLHPAMKHAIGPRRELGIRTFFNVLGPLTNPAYVKNQVIGVFSCNLLEMMTGTLKEMGSKRAMIVNSLDGLDEISLCDDTCVSELCEDGTIKNYKINPKDFGIPLAKMEDLLGGDIDCNVKIVHDILDGKQGPKTDVVVLNAGAAIYVSGAAASLVDGIEMAREAIDSGAAKRKLQDLKKMTN